MIEIFTNQEGTGAAIDHCIKLYLNTAKYEPLKGSSYIPSPKPIANKKAIINVKNNVDKCLEWALKSALYVPQKLMQTINTVIQRLTAQTWKVLKTFLDLFHKFQKLKNISIWQ